LNLPQKEQKNKTTKQQNNKKKKAARQTLTCLAGLVDDDLE